MEVGKLLRTATVHLIFSLVIWQGRLSQGQNQSPDPPELTQQPDRPIYYITTDGTVPRVSLPCEAIGTQPLHYRWEQERNGVRLNKTITVENGTLLVEAVAENVDGNYTCFVSNDFGTVVSSTAEVKFAHINLTGLYDGEFNQTFTVFEGHPLVLPCRVPGDPTPRIDWLFKNNTPVFPSSNTHNTESSWNPAHNLAQNEDGSLVFLNAAMNDGAVYECTAMSPAIPTRRYLFARKEVIVKKRNGSSLRPPMILDSSREITALRGENVKLYCLATGNPAPSVTWTRADRPSFRGEGPVLSLTNVTLRDAGVYTCNASTASYQVNETTTLAVEAAPYWVSMPRDVTVYLGENANVSCEAGGKPSPMITWMENGVQKPQFDNRSSVSVLEASKDDVKVYQCVASNTHGRIIRNIILNVKERAPTSPPPLEPPTGIKAKSEGATSVIISWNPIQDPRLDMFRVQYKRADGQHHPKLKDCEKETSCELTNLRASTPYLYKVTAVYGSDERTSEWQQFQTRRAKTTPKGTEAPYTGPRLWNLITLASGGVLVIGTATPLIMCVVLCIRDQINGYDPDDDLPTESDEWGPGRPKPKVEKVKTVRPVLRTDDEEPSPGKDCTRVDIGTHGNVKETELVD